MDQEFWQNSVGWFSCCMWYRLRSQGGIQLEHRLVWTVQMISLTCLLLQWEGLSECTPLKLLAGALTARKSQDVFHDGPELPESISKPPRKNCITFCALTLKCQNIIPATFSWSNKWLQPAQIQREGHWTQPLSEGLPKLLDHLESTILEIGKPVKSFLGEWGDYVDSFDIINMEKYKKI